MTPSQACSPHLVRYWQTLTDTQLRARMEDARASVAAFTRATEACGSLIQSWVRGEDVVEMDHYPPHDIVDAGSGSQFYYHCHRHDGSEHGHLHLFWHATRSGRRRRTVAETRRWVRTDPTHLFAISLDARGLPRALFTVNRWVTEGHWFDATTMLCLVDRFAMRLVEGHEHSCAWLTSFVRMYRPVVEELLKERDLRLASRPDLAAALTDPELEVLSRIEIEWGADLDALGMAVAARRRSASSRRRRATAGRSTNP